MGRGKGRIGREGVGRMEWSGGGKWDNYISIINKYIKKRNRRRSKTQNSKMTTNLELTTTEPTKQKQKLSKQLGQEQNHRDGDHLEGYQWGGRGGRMGEKVEGIRSIIGRYKIDRGSLRIV